MTPSPLAYRDPRRFSPARLSSHSLAQMHRLALDLEDIRYTFTSGTRVRSAGGKHLFIVLRRKDIPIADRALERVRRREGIVLHLDRHGWIVDIGRDPRAYRRLRSHHGQPIPRSRHCRLG